MNSSKLMNASTSSTTTTTTTTNCNNRSNCCGNSGSGCMSSIIDDSDESSLDDKIDFRTTNRQSKCQASGLGFRASTKDAKTTRLLVQNGSETDETQTNTSADDTNQMDNNNIMSVDKYLERINCSNVRDNSLQCLYKLQRNHLINVPFENLDIHLNKHIDCLDLVAIYEKVVVKRRGGFSFELNQIFAWLLEQLGYSVEFLSCSAYDDKLKSWTPWCGHMILIVHINEESSYLCDVGFKSNYRTPLKLKLDLIQTDATGYYKIVGARDNENECTIVKCSKPLSSNDALSNAEWRPVYKLRRKACALLDFRDMMDYVQTKEFTFFSHSSMAAIHTTHSILILTGYKLSEIIYFDSIEKTCTNSTLNKREVFEALKNIYGIDLDAEFEPIDQSTTTTTTT